MRLALQDTAVARCGESGSAFTYFNRSMTMQCFDRAARARAPPKGLADVGSYRVLMTGFSNMRHIWHALGADDVFADAARGEKNCAPFSQTLPSFAPHAVHYQPWQVVTNTTKIFHKTSKSCWATHALGGGLLEWVVANAPLPYDVVGINVGAWDASFTSRDEAAFEAGFRGGVRYLRAEWPAARIILVTLTPCGAVRPNTRRATPVVACEWVSFVNAVVRRTVEAVPGLQLLDAHQMVRSHPASNRSGYPPGFWVGTQSAGWHFEQVVSKAARDRARALVPPSAAGEMYRAIANRLIGMACQ